MNIIITLLTYIALVAAVGLAFYMNPVLGVCVLLMLAVLFKWNPPDP